ncbi:MAG: Wzz/FepE/Etk N-terminal domain-containing protein [Lachnospiraceae bacterium]|nr:Wzz/FepE/Etk N-terminal domain-containing protein [Lachnospiraceae bacterium]
MENVQTLDYDNEIEIDLKDLCLELLSFWKLILLALVLGGVIAYSMSRFLMVPQYESVAELYVLSKSTSITSLADIQAGTSLTNDYMVVVKGRPVIEQVIVNLKLDETYGTLSDKVELNNPTNSRVLEIRVRDEDPRMAKKIADEIAKVSAAFIAEKMDQDAPSTIQYGYSDGSPVSPNIPKNTIIGALLGAFLAIAVIVIAYLFNDTIMNAEDVEKKLGLNVLGTLPMEDTEYDGEHKGGRKEPDRKNRHKGKQRDKGQVKAS